MKFLRFAPVVVIVALLASWFLREPVVVVANAAFDSIYGKRRTVFSHIADSIHLWRPIHELRIDDRASADQIAAAAVNVRKHPYCIVFLYEYAEAAERCVTELAKKGVKPPPVYVLGNWEQKPSSLGAARFVKPDPLAALEEAGRLAGKTTGKAGVVYVMGQSPFPQNFRAAFEKGLLENADWPKNKLPQWSAAQNVDSLKAGDCVVIASGSVPGLLTKPTAARFIVFTWLDPAYMPDNVVAVFDDSFWALLPALAKQAALDRARGGGKVTAADAPAKTDAHAVPGLRLRVLQ